MTDRDDVRRDLRSIRTVAETNETAELEAVQRARDLELSWEIIARELGRTRSAVWNKYHDKTH